MRANMRTCLVTVASAMLLSACVFFVRGVHDLRFVAVHPVEFGQINLQTGVPLDLTLAEDHALGNIEVASKADIHKIAIESQLNIWYELQICKTGATVPALSHVYFQGIEANYVSMSPEVQDLYAKALKVHEPNGSYVYEIYFEPKSDLDQQKGSGHPRLYQPYDFTHTPLDLCLRIGGGNMGGSHFVSNTVEIPASAIAKAFKH
jgi:hypothetical protein